MLPAKNRLKKQKDFEKVFKEGKGYKEGFLYFKIVNNGLETSRFGFIVGKKFSKKAVERNKIKRQLREIVRINLPRIKKGFDAAIMALPSPQKSDFEDLEKMLGKIFQKSKILEKTK